uniref:Auxin-responsive protein n=1 Tax=Ananas comosus var. bracteatus TaxID=296719 RepID=A0A6V7PJJ5_ANACO|nr:unnamed protein product [Ananas comosus var. bracteatus]
MRGVLGLRGARVELAGEVARALKVGAEGPRLPYPHREGPAPLTSPRSSAASSSSSRASASATKRAKADNNPLPRPLDPLTLPEANVGASKEANADFSVKDVHVPKRASSSCSSSSSSSPFVKVYMDGDPIGRKVDLSAHHSYESLALSLELMFRSPTLPLSASVVVINGATASKLLDGSSEFALTYEDREGDCMLVGDVPWEMFLDNVKRLRIMRPLMQVDLQHQGFTPTNRSDQ